jgi:hypothetical protein
VERDRWPLHHFVVLLERLDDAITRDLAHHIAIDRVIPPDCRFSRLPGDER